MTIARTLHYPLAALSGAILVFAFPRWNVEVCVWLWLIPLLSVLWLSEVRKRRAFALGYFAGLCFFVPNLSWLRHSSRVISGAVDDRWMGWPVELMGWGAVAGMTLFLSLYFAVWAVFASKFAKPRRSVLLHGSVVDVSLECLRSAALAGFAWVALEWLRGWVFTGFGWNGLGVGLHQNKLLIQMADCIGVAGVSFLPVFMVCALFIVVLRIVLHAKHQKPRRWYFDLVGAMAVLIAWASYGINKLSLEGEVESVPVRVAMVQLNIPQAVRWSGEKLVETYHRFADLTRLYAEPRDGTKASPVDLVVWPESALGLPYYHPDHPPYFNDLLALGDYSLLTGCDVLEPAGESHVSAALFNKGWDSSQLYHKVHLVPFGEYLPLRPILGPILEGILPSDFDHGSSTEPLTLAKPDIQIIPLICFEDTDGNLARKFVRDQPQLIVNMTNDGWFLHSHQTEQHTANAIFRAIELRRSMVRACNTGVTCVIDDKGRITSRLHDPETGDTFIEGVLPATIAVAKHPPLTPYARWGDWFAMLSLALCLLAYSSALIAARRSA